MLHVGRLQRVEVDGPPEVALVALVRVVALDHPRGLGVGERPALDRGAAVAGDLGLDDLEDLGAGRGPAR